MSEHRQRQLAKRLVGRVVGKTWLRNWVRSISVRQAGSVDHEGNVVMCLWLRVPAKEIAEFENVESMDKARRDP